ncbi:hypothetical protein Ocin01_14188 [Orchesella cincta]|uniref:Histone H4 n=1 Tax=Orchesella cincta TaxID=48709 RepID=A0A1D2MI26_ORCCI|nr:hypothetical protein Ocin01_14188 [Orchesella cincta]
MTGRGKGGKGLGKGVPSVTGKFCVITSKVSPSRHPSSRSSWWSQAYFWTHLRGDSWSSQSIS